jgi:predicted RNA binding protein YcfA (HicA-like mRNA interferase family)
VIFGLDVALGQRHLRKCHDFETDHGDIAVRQLRKPSSHKINMSSGMRTYDGRMVVVPDHGGRDLRFGTLMKIITEDAELTVDEFKDAL